MKRILFVYLLLAAAAAGLILVSPQWGGLAMLCVLIAWFIHGVFVSTGDPRIG